MNLKYLKIIVWLLLTIAIVILLFSFTLDRSGSLVYAVIAMVFWGMSKLLNMYIKKKNRELEEN